MILSIAPFIVVRTARSVSALTVMVFEVECEIIRTESRSQSLVEQALQWLVLGCSGARQYR